MPQNEMLVNALKGKPVKKPQPKAQVGVYIISPNICKRFIFNYLFKETIYETDFRFIIIFQDKKGSPATSLAGKKPPSTGSNPTENGLLEGISSLHSWIKSQTMIKPAGREKEDIPGLIRANYNNDEVMKANIIRGNILKLILKLK